MQLSCSWYFELGSAGSEHQYINTQAHTDTRRAFIPLLTTIALIQVQKTALLLLEVNVSASFETIKFNPKPGDSADSTSKAPLQLLLKLVTITFSEHLGLDRHIILCRATTALKFQGPRGFSFSFSCHHHHVPLPVVFHALVKLTCTSLPFKVVFTQEEFLGKIYPY